MEINSLQNPRVKYIVKLREDKRVRQRDGLMIVEGHDELVLALACGLKAESLLTCPELVTQSIQVDPSEVITVSSQVFKKMSYRDHPDGWLAIFPIPKTSLGEIRLSRTPLVIVTESIEKPGNLGAILRTADACGVDAVIVCDPRVDVWNPNVVRASRGALFTVPIAEADSPTAMAWLRSHGMQILAATPSAHKHYTEVDLKGPTAIVVGTEDVGLTDQWISSADIPVQIPMAGKVNSLNVSIATALITYEAVRQRRTI